MDAISQLELRRIPETASGMQNEIGDITHAL